MYESLARGKKILLKSVIYWIFNYLKRKCDTNPWSMKKHTKYVTCSVFQFNLFLYLVWFSFHSLLMLVDSFFYLYATFIYSVMALKPLDVYFVSLGVSFSFYFLFCICLYKHRVFAQVNRLWKKQNWYQIHLLLCTHLLFTYMESIMDICIQCSRFLLHLLATQWVNRVNHLTERSDVW